MATLFSIGSSLTAVPALLPNASFNLETDFAPVVHFATGYNVLVVNPKIPVHSVSELIEFLKKNPDKHTFSSGGFGTPAHLLGELFKLEVGVKTTHVPCNQFPQAMTSCEAVTALPYGWRLCRSDMRSPATRGKKTCTAGPQRFYGPLLLS